jgi:hypothetical protein
MQQNGDAERQHLIERADALEKSLDLAQRSMVRTEHLMELMEEIANEFHGLAEDWEEVEAQRAERFRAHEHQIRALGEEFAHLEEMEAADARAIIAALRRLARGPKQTRT